MLLKLVELRSSNWGRVQITSTYREATPENDPNYFMVIDLAVFFQLGVGGWVCVCKYTKHDRLVKVLITFISNTCILILE